MPIPRPPIRLALALLCATAAGAQTAPPSQPKTAVVKPRSKVTKPEKPAGPTYNPNLIVLDPAHGGADNGAKLGEGSFEKDANIAFAAKLRAELAAKGFTVVLTHENATDEVNPDTRIELANRNHPVACILLHASNGGHGVHLYTSSLAAASFNPYATNFQDESHAVIPWDTAQASTNSQSLRLKNDLASALNGMRIPLVVSQASIRPIDSMTCPAVIVEISPLNANGDLQTAASDPNYQQRVADSVATGLVFWRGHAVSASVAAQAAKANEPATPAAPAPAGPKPKPKPKPIVIPEELPADAPPAKSAVPAVKPAAPAPIVRKDPDTSGGAR